MSKKDTIVTIKESSPEATVVEETSIPVLNDFNRKVSDAIYAAHKLDKDSGVFEQIDVLETVKHILPEGATSESVQFHQDLIDNITAGTVDAIGRATADAMHANKKLPLTTAVMKYGSSNIHVSVEREHTFVFGTGENKKNVTKTGVVHISLDHKAGRSSGELKKAKDLTRLYISGKLGTTKEPA